MELLRLVLLAVVVLALLMVARHDLRHFTIPNRAIATLCVLACAVLALPGAPDGTQAILAAVILTAIGVVAWAMGAMGAGDAKMGAPLGLLVGTGGLVPFAALLGMACVALLVAIALLGDGRQGRGWRAALGRMARERRVPFALPMVAAALPVIAVIHGTAHP